MNLNQKCQTFLHHLQHRIREFPVNAVVIAWSAWAVLVAATLFVTFSPQVEIQNTSCQLDGLKCPEVVVAQLKKLHGENMFFIDYAALTAKIKSNVAIIQSASIELDFPQTVHLKLQSRVPFAVITMPDKKQIVIAQNGLMLESEPLSTLPHIQYQKAFLPLNDAHVSDPDISAVLNLIALHRELNLPYDHWQLELDGSVMVQLNGGKSAVYTTHKPLGPQVSSLQLILQKSTIAQAKPIIDIRFENPILRSSLVLPEPSTHSAQNATASGGIVTP